MREARGERLDLLDTAAECGWRVECTQSRDQFQRRGVTIVATYSPDEEITSVVRSGEDGAGNSLGAESTNKTELLKFWLTGRSPLPVDELIKVAPRVIPKLRWSREKYLNKETQELADYSDPRVPKTNAAMTRQRTWHIVGSQANVEGGYYRRDLDMSTSTLPEMTYEASWNPTNGPREVILRGSGGQTYTACVKHYQANYTPGLECPL